MINAPHVKILHLHPADLHVWVLSINKVSNLDNVNVVSCTNSMQCQINITLDT